MTGENAFKLIAIIGGGIAALSAAFDIIKTTLVNALTIYTLSWRFGGKCASSRGPDGRI